MVVRPPSKLALWTALWTVYLVWGSTYLAIKISVETLPPLLSAGLRFLTAGLLLAGALVAIGRSLRVGRREALAAGGLGVMLLTFGVGVVTLAETRIDSSVAAMIAGSVPLQVVAMRTAARESVAGATRLAALVGLVGLGLIVVPGGTEGGSTAVGLALMLGASVSWSTGSFVSRRLRLPQDPFVSTVYQMAGGGLVLVTLALAAGEWRDVGADALATGPLLAWAYLVVAGSLVGFTAYAWLLRSAPISLVVTHQYVNPLVALVLGAVVLGERPSAAILVGAAIVVGAVFVTVRRETIPEARGEVAAVPARAR
jgi:drug/metabolite transporter (DMT)-like permease